MNAIGYFEIQSSNPQRDIKFYKSVFGWKFIRENYIPFDYYRIETGGINGGLIQRPAPIPPAEYGANAFVNSILVDSFDNTAELIIKKGGQIALPKFAIPGRCWQGYFIDPDGNTFGIFEADSNAK